MRRERRVGRRRRSSVWKGLVAGAAGGLAAAWTMNQFQALWSILAEGEERSHGAQSMQQGTPRHGIGREGHDSVQPRIESIRARKVRL